MPLHRLCRRKHDADPIVVFKQFVRFCFKIEGALSAGPGSSSNLSSVRGLLTFMKPGVKKWPMGRAALWECTGLTECRSARGASKATSMIRSVRWGLSILIKEIRL